ncbi:NRDE family protein [Seongchinamella sediminis]|uniref:NRDE family protein n=1 Tax=Seongchinamella sediminis TaxID=2283635 RepID=A0A3L7E4G2_9GAMM|nr:NRDE family protein [Seongchinamella sediminis]RLQ23463.1 NRDE family protein [Seongchinamella sediminis]
MCLILFAHRASDDYPLVVAANRDEFHDRPTAPAQLWQDHPGLLAGRDLQAGGTWMGIHRNGRFAAITNFRDPARTVAAPRSRGELTTRFLLGDASPQDFLGELQAAAGDYAGFNLLLGAGDELWYFSNSATGPAATPRPLAPGIYGLSNALLDTPWPKVERGKQALTGVLAARDIDHERLATVVTDRQLASREQLDLQGLNGEMAQLLSAQFIVNPRYGTRATTTCWRDATGTFHWREQTIGADGGTKGAVELELATQPDCE